MLGMRKRSDKKMALVCIKLSLAAMAIASAFPAHHAYAQTAPDAADANSAPTAAPVKDNGKLETVIVTANRVAENARDVAMSVSAIKGADIDVYNSGGEDITVLAGRAPSLNIESDFGRSFPRFYIRGLGNIDFDLNASQPVGVVFDDVVQENPVFKGFPMFDLDQVEVLAGPQGTLFGRNSPAGVVKFDSAKPDNTYGGYLNMSYGRWGTTNLETALNAPLGNGWALRFSGMSQNRDDFIYNPEPTGTQNFGGYHDAAGRLQLSYTNGDFYALFNVHGRDMSGDATLFRANIVQPGGNGALVPGFNFYSYPTDGINTQTLYSDGASMRLRWNLNGITLHSITAWDSARYFSRADVDGGYGVCGGTGPSGPGPCIPFISETADGAPNLTQFTQEFRVQSNTKDPLQWLAGLYYFKENMTIDSYDYNSLAAGNPQDGFAYQYQHAQSWAAFGSLSYAVSDRLKLRAGLRYTNDEKQSTAQNVVSPPGGSGATSVINDNISSNNTSWDLSADYALDSTTSVYARVATGYRAPSIQARLLFGNTTSVAQAETNLSYEAGIKKDLWDGRARVSATAYTYTVSNMQLTAGSGALNQNQLVNAAKVVGNGIETQFQARLSREWKTTLGLSYNYTKIKDPNLFVQPCGDGCTVLNTPSATNPGFVSLDGSPLPRAPKLTFNFNLNYTTPLYNGDFYANTDWTYKSSNNIFLYTATEFTEQPLWLGGLNLGYKWDGGKYEVGAYVRNLTNKVQLISAIDFDNLTGIVNDPRSYGVQFKMNF
jgi:iron complex outermembrane receptor protein